jgi:hypothetical protein
MPEWVSCEYYITSGRKLRFQPRKTFVGNASRLPGQVKITAKKQMIALALI